MLQTIQFGDFYQFLEMIYAGMHTSVRCKAHQMKAFARFLHISISFFDTRIFQNTIVPASPIDFHKVLIYDTACTDIEVTHLTISHLTIRQTYIFTARLELGMWESSIDGIEIWSRGIVDDI